MAEPGGTTPQSDADRTGVDAPTEVLPTGAIGPDPTLPMPVSPWSRPDANWAAPDERTRATWAQAGPQQGYAGQQAYPGQPTPGQQTYPGQQGYPSQPYPGQQCYPSQPYPGQPGFSQQSYAGQGYPVQQGYPQQGSGQEGYPPQAYSGQQNAYPDQHAHPGQDAYPGHPGTSYGPPQYPSGSAPGGSLQPAATPPRRGARRGVALVLAVVLALVVAGVGSGWAARVILGTDQPSPSSTQPQIEPSSPVDPVPGGGQSGGSRPTTGGNTTSDEVSAAESAGVVMIEARSSAGLGAGTGMVLTADGKVLTNYHVVAGSEKLAVTIADSGDTYAATVIGFDQTRDVALLQLKDASGLATVRPDTQVPEVGTNIAAVGNAGGRGALVKAPGNVTGTDQDLTVSSESPWGNTEDLSGLICTDAGAVPGDSGGPMFDDDSEVIGMTTAGSTRKGTSCAVPIGTALQVVAQIDTGRDAGSVRVGPAGYLGIKVDDQQSGTGKTITEVVEGSPAAQAGMTAGSRLTQVNGTAIRATTNLATVIRALEPGEQVRIGWTTADGTKRSSTVTLGSSPVA